MRAPKKNEEIPDEDVFLPAPDLPPPLDDDADPELLEKDYYAERREEERRAALVQKRLIAFGVALAAIAVPLVYLRATGKLTRKSVAQIVAKPTPAPKGIAQPRPNFGNSVAKPLDAVARDLQDYTNNSLPALAPLENKAVFDFASVTGTNFRSNEEGVKVIREKVIPEFEEFLKQAGKVSPKTPEVREAHGIFMASERAKGRAYKLILRGVSEKNNTFVGQSQKEFGDAKRQSELFFARLKIIAEKHNVVLQGF